MNLDLFGVGIKSRSEVMTAQRRVNVYYEEQKDEDRGTRIAVLGTPGLELFMSFGETPARLLYPKGDFLYVVHRGTFYEVNNAGVATARGTLLTSSGRCYAADNGTQIMVSDGVNGYIYTIGATTFALIVDPDFPGALNVTWQDGRFIVPKPDSGRWYISDSYDGTSWDALNFKNAESLPDDNIFAYSDGGTLAIFGGGSTEFYGNTGAAGVPFSRVSGGNLRWGLAAKDSLVRFQDSMIGLLRNDMGQAQVAKIASYRPEPVSTPDFEDVMRSYGSIADATAFSHKMNGHPFYQINFPSADASWLYDGLTGVWSEVSRTGGGRHRAELQANYIDRTIVSDYSNGNLYFLDPDAYTDNGGEIRRLLVSRHITNGGNPLTIDELRLTFATGVGVATGQGVNPEVMLRYSKDGGRTWGPERRKNLGAIGKYGIPPVRFTQFGQAEDFVFELAMTDPVKFMLVGEAIEAEQHAWA